MNHDRPQPVLDDQAQAFLDAQIAAGLPPVTEMSVAEARQVQRDAYITDAPLPEILAVSERRLAAPLGGFPVRVYRPAEGSLPLTMVFHGGGWTLNDLDTHERVCRRLANTCETVVVAVGLRRSPEFPYPTQVEDCYLATTWAVRHADELGIDARRVGLFGDSSGGTNVAAVSLLARDRGFPDIGVQCMLYPVTDAPSSSSPSYQDYGTGYALDAPTMHWFWEQYTSALADLDLDDPYLCPLRADDLSGLPDALVVTAEFDPLYDEGRRYAERLRAAGNDVVHHHVGDLMHNFLMQTDDIARAEDEVSWVLEHFRDRLALP